MIVDTAMREIIAENYAGRGCTLNGHPAKVCGRLNRTAMVSPLDMRQEAVEFSWRAVALVMEEHNGAFKS